MSGRRAAFIDRDGTLIVERHYLADPDGVHFTDGAIRALRRLEEAGFVLVLVTNQSGIGRGLYTLADFEAVQARIRERLAAEGVHLAGVYFCPHHPDEACACRKPGTALFEQAAAELGLDLGASVYIGDRLKDVEPAWRLGGRAILVRTGYGAEQELLEGHVIEVVGDLAEAAERVVQG